MNAKKVLVHQVGANSITFAARTGSNHWIVMDGPEEHGGQNAGVRPKELILVALAGCTGSDVASILAKKKVPLNDFQIEVTANESAEHPKVFTSLHVKYLFYGSNITPKDVERAIELSLTKYCSVTAMLRQAAEVTHSYEIIPDGKLA